MIKAFISHSSKQKDFALELVERLGRDFCRIDCYNFEPAYKTLDEIYKNIEESTVFVLLLSHDSLNSNWVKKEIKIALKRMESDKLMRFWPYIIDDTLTIEECPKWMKDDECFNLRKFKSPYILACDIEQKFRKILWSKNSKRKRLDSFMVGRNNDIAKFEEKFQSFAGLKLRSLIISGRDGVGKDTFAKQCMQKVGYAPEIEPYRISTSPKENVENFIIYLNIISRTYTTDELQNVLNKEPKEKAHIVVELLNELYNTQSTVFVNDDMACVLPNRDVSQWLKDVLEDPALNNQLGLYIMTRKSPNSFVDSEYPQIAHIQLMPLDRKDRVKLFVNCVRAYELTDITEEDISFFVDRLLQSPQQILQVVEALNTKPKALVKKDINSLVSIGDKKIQPLLKHFSEDEQRYLLIILSKLDFVSYKILERIFGERIIEAIKILDEMIEYGIVSTFGPSEQYFRLDHYLADYIRRCHMSLPKDWELHVEEVLETHIERTDCITEDTSLYLYDIKQKILSRNPSTNTFLIPSIVVSTIVEIYNKQDYQLVIQICDSVLTEMHNYYEDVVRELRYWLCLALCRTQTERFFDEVKNIKGADSHFLYGFYFRIKKEYPKAESYFRKALDLSHNMQRAKRELVTALLAQNKYQVALNMAKENYESYPENSYQIQGYFRCLVRKNNLERHDYAILDELMDAMKNNYSDKHEELFLAMNIEYQAYIKHMPYEYMYSLIKKAKRQFPKSYNIERASYLYMHKHGIVTREQVFDED
ncbi:MAG: TIR domain-containing protein [Prevotella sp.]|nr:TIR domain-containing protein [Prevotella sp.]